MAQVDEEKGEAGEDEDTIGVNIIESYFLLQD